MATLTAPRRSGDVVKYHLHEYSIDPVTLLGGVGADRALPVGAVLAKITASGKYVGHDPAAQDGSQTPAGVLIEPMTAPENVDTAASMIARHAVVSRKALVWKDGATAEQIAAGEASLVALGILVRDTA